MTLLQRLTTQYVDVEDRIRLSGEDAQGKVKVLWLTQRMLARLVPALCKTLAPGADTRTDLLNSFEQQAAQARLAPQDPVPAASSSAASLVTRVDLTPTGQGLRLAFFAHDEEVAAVLMPELPLRQWLSILRQQYQAGAWPDDVWPDWTEAAPAAPQHGQAWH